MKEYQNKTAHNPEDESGKEMFDNIIFGEWEKQVDALEENEGHFKEYVDTFLKATGYPETSPLVFMFKGYLMGFNGAMDIMNFLEGLENE